MAQYDEIVKHLMHQYADEFAMLSFGTSNVQVLETLDTEQQAVKVHRKDMTFKVLWHNETVLLHIAEVWLQRCVEKTEAAPVDTQTRGTLLFALSMFGTLVHDPNFFDELISEEIMQESPFYEIVIKRGVQQGSRETTIKNVLSVLTERFPQSDVQPVVEALESIQDIDRLTELHRTAVRTFSVEKFLQGIDKQEV